MSLSKLITGIILLIWGIINLIYSSKIAKWSSTFFYNIYKDFPFGLFKDINKSKSLLVLSKLSIITFSTLIVIGGIILIIKYFKS